MYLYMYGSGGAYIFIHLAVKELTTDTGVNINSYLIVQVDVDYGT